ncbi:LLM class flavin-dependent oxidoreductase [Thiohalorhabdus methylotrophus]|uniref:LLM class flavin-dependent oxidoreductase n=1 Tax=Thiohalorhabdus methylotrophus TaxID=3242694 RepID=A0ABV4U102_9GAMM
MTALSILDLAPIRQGGDAADAFRHTRELARHAEAWGYRRFWLAEHHNMTGIGSSATAVLIGHVAEATRTIRVGAGGVMLPNHAPLVVAEQFGTLATLHPDRIDLGLGRAPGTDRRTVRALRRERTEGAERFPQDLEELLDYFRPAGADRPVQAVPGAGLGVPVWVLGSSLNSAELAAQLGLPYAFASHFAPYQLLEALSLYRHRFQPSEYLDRPYTMAGLNVAAADSDAEARRQFTAVQQQFVSMVRGRTPGPLPPPVEHMDAHWSPEERERVSQMLWASVVGGPESVRAGLARFAERTGADEIMATTQMYEPSATLRSFELLAEAHASLGAESGTGA